MQVSEKQFLEELIEKVPGIKGYRDREARRDTDKRLRETLAADIDTARGRLVNAQRDLLDAGHLDLLSVADRVGRKLQRAADALRYASYGYSGLFAQLKIQEDELQRMYDYDHGLIADIRDIGAKVQALSPSDAKAGLEALESADDTLIDAIDERKRIFDQPE